VERNILRTIKRG